MTKLGRTLENLISEKLLKINRQENGFFIKSPTPIKMIANHGKIVPIYSNKALCDFVGIYNEKFILIETKNISGVRFEFKRLKDHQQKQLSAIKRHGGISILIFYLVKSYEMVILEIDKYLVFKSQTEKKSIHIDTLKEIGQIIFPDDIEKYLSLLSN